MLTVLRMLRMLRNAENAENADCDPLTTSPTDAKFLSDLHGKIIISFP